MNGLRSDRMLPFREHFDEFERQPLLVSRAKYQRAVELALSGRCIKTVVSKTP